MTENLKPDDLEDHAPYWVHFEGAWHLGRYRYLEENDNRYSDYHIFSCEKRDIDVEYADAVVRIKKPDSYK